MGRRKTKKWPDWSGEPIIGLLPRRHFAVAVQYPGDSNYYVECRRMPSRKDMMRLLKKMQREDIKEMEWDEAFKVMREKP
jgi:hypothetical protein